MHPETWDEYLDAVMFGLRTKKQMITKYSPFYLMFGRDARYPSQVPENYTVCFCVFKKFLKTFCFLFNFLIYCDCYLSME